jgi:hypothetical protein
MLTIPSHQRSLTCFRSNGRAIVALRSLQNLNKTGN